MMFEPFLKTPGEELEILIYAFPCYAANTGQVSTLANLVGGLLPDSGLVYHAFGRFSFARTELSLGYILYGRVRELDTGALLLYLGTGRIGAIRWSAPGVVV
jgi:hypothetical protein